MTRKRLEEMSVAEKEAYRDDLLAALDSLSDFVAHVRSPEAQQEAMHARKKIEEACDKLNDAFVEFEFALREYFSGIRAAVPLERGDPPLWLYFDGELLRVESPDHALRWQPIRATSIVTRKACVRSLGMLLSAMRARRWLSVQ